MAVCFWFRNFISAPFRAEHLINMLAQKIGEIISPVRCVNLVAYSDEPLSEILRRSDWVPPSQPFDPSALRFHFFSQQGSCFLNYSRRRSLRLLFHFLETTLLELCSAATGTGRVPTNLSRATVERGQRHLGACSIQSTTVRKQNGTGRLREWARGASAGL